MFPCPPGAGMLWILSLTVAFLHTQPKEGQKTLSCGLSAEKNISSLTIWLTAIFRAKVPLVWKMLSVTHFLGYSAIREEWNKKVKWESERERERERERGSEKKEREKELFKWCYLSLPSSLASPAHSKSFTSVVHIMLRVRTHGTPLSFPHMVILRLKEEHVSKEMSLVLDRYYNELNITCNY